MRPGGWTECGVMYKNKFTLFLKVFVEIKPSSLMVMVRSRKSTVVVGCTKVHLSLHALSMSTWNSFHAEGFLRHCRFGNKIQKYVYFVFSKSPCELSNLMDIPRNKWI